MTDGAFVQGRLVVNIAGIPLRAMNLRAPVLCSAIIAIALGIYPSIALSIISAATKLIPELGH